MAIATKLESRERQGPATHPARREEEHNRIPLAREEPDIEDEGEDEEAPETPLDEPPPVPIQDPPADATPEPPMTVASSL